MSVLAESETASGAVEGILNYVAPDTAFSRRFCFPGDEVNTGRFVPHRVAIRNARAAPERVALDTHGFELFRIKARSRASTTAPRSRRSIRKRSSTR